MIQRWSGRAALVTGTSGGIGAAVTETLAGEVGMRVAALAWRGSRLRDMAARVGESGGTVLSVQGDVTVDEDVAAVFERVRSERGGIDLLVNNAGVAATAPLAEGSPADWRSTLDVGTATTTPPTPNQRRHVARARR